MNFDLTTKKGQKEASQYLGLGLLGIISPPLGIVAWLISKKEKSAIRQIELAERLVKTGEEKGIENLEITLGENVGLSLGANIKGFPVNAMLGSDDKMTLKVKYK